MTETFEKPKIAERYASAIEATNLHVKTTNAGPVDVIIASGWSGDSIGAILSRLRSEFDSVRGEHERAGWVLKNAHEMADQAQKAADRTASPRLAEMAKAIREAADREALTARALIMVHLKTLGEAKRALGDFAIKQSVLRNRRLQADRVLKIAGQCLDAFLDPLCAHCEGRGFTGGGRGVHQGLQVNCRPCGGTATQKGSGQRRHAAGQNMAERDFADHMLTLMSKAVGNHERRMQQRLRG